MECVSNQADRLAQNARECLDDIHRRSEAADQSPISFPIALECLLSLLKQF